MQVQHSISTMNRSLVHSIILPLVLIIAGEALLFTGNLYGCLALHLLNVTVCVLAVLLFKQSISLWQTFALVSLLRVLNIGMPKFDTVTLHWIPLIYAPIIFVCVMQVYDVSGGWRSLYDRIRRPPALHRISTRSIYYLMFALAVSLPLASLGFTILDPSVPRLWIIPDQSWENLVLAFVVFMLFVSLGEELLFRKILQERLAVSPMSPYLAIVISSLVFAVMYASYESIPFIIYIFSIGLLLGLVYYGLRNFALVVVIHGLLDFFLFAVLPFWL